MASWAEETLYETELVEVSADEDGGRHAEVISSVICEDGPGVDIIGPCAKDLSMIAPSCVQ